MVSLQAQVFLAQQHLPEEEHLQSLAQPLLEQQQESLAQVQEPLVQHLASQQQEVLAVEQAAQGAGAVQQVPEVQPLQPADFGQEVVHGEVEQGMETHIPPQEFVPEQTGAGQVPQGVGVCWQQPVVAQVEPVQTD